MKTGAALMAEAKARVREVSARDVLDMHARGERVTLLDVRDLHEVNLGKLPGALHISRGNLETKVEAQISRDAHVVIYCASGNRSVFAADRLQEMGYANVASMAGGFRGWVEAGGDVD
ncbi:MAG TPA: rhodanese-like domain-containing protein [Gemmatimonadaceae bacterium]|jgi:rhodanese-related sulfurtransferase|nr:rhodanese-like domain-containing protein [Gemmatimonadaceae bacterium]